MSDIYNLRNDVIRAEVTSTIAGTPALTYAYEYDEWGRLRTRTTPDAGTKTFEYDVRHRLIKIKDAKNQETSFEYNDFDQITKGA